MTADSTTSDPYEAVLTDLRAKRDHLDSIIANIEAFRGGTTTSNAGSISTTAPESATDGPGAFLGMTIQEAAKKLLASRRQPLRNPEIAAAFKTGGLILQSTDPANTIGSVLTRRFNEVGDIVKVGRGTWGLKEWYPGRSFKKEKNGSDEQARASAPGQSVGE